LLVSWEGEKKFEGNSIVAESLSKRTSGAKALICGELFGTGEPVPLQVERLFGGLRWTAGKAKKSSRAIP